MTEHINYVKFTPTDTKWPTETLPYTNNKTDKVFHAHISYSCGERRPFSRFLVQDGKICDSNRTLFQRLSLVISSDTLCFINPAAVHHSLSESNGF